MNQISLTINNISIKGNSGDTIMETAINNGINIMGLCYCSEIKPESSCRLCLVSIKGRQGLFTACNTKIENGMDIKTDSDEVKVARNINFEMIFSRHCQNCLGCRRRNHCKIIEIAKKCDFNITNKKKHCFSQLKIGPAITLDYGKCINCNNCIQTCNNQGVGCLAKTKDGGFSKINCNNEKCVYCGQCLAHCPSGALEEKSSIVEVVDLLKKKDNFVIFQFSSGMVMSLQNEIGLHGGIGQLCKAFKAIGAKMVYDTSFAVDLIVEKESSDLAAQIENKQKGCLFTSHCPSWVRYVNVHHPELNGQLSKNKSPHIICGSIIKKYLTKKGIPAEKIFVVSIAPCTAKKFEILEPGSFYDGVRAVDFLLTTNEVCLILKTLDMERINFENFDDVFMKEIDPYSSNEEIVKTGIKIFYKKMTGKKLSNINFLKMTGAENISEADILIGSKKIKIGIAYGLHDAKDLIEKNKYNRFDYLEVMACPKGCLGGGGQPIGSQVAEIKKSGKNLKNIKAINNASQPFNLEEKEITNICKCDNKNKFI